MLFLNRQQVESLLDPDQLIDALAPAMVDLSAGAVSMPSRIAAQVSDVDGLLGVMPAYVSSSTLAAKLVAVFPRNADRGMHTHQALLTLFDADTGTPLAVIDGTAITAARTAAGSALATRLLALPDADCLLIVGTGVQARSHARHISRVRDLKEVRVVGRNKQKAEALAGEITAALGLPASSGTSFRDAAAGAHIICATTHASEPVVYGAHLDPGTHINSVGVNPQGGEIDDATIARSLIVVESRLAALVPTGIGGATELIQAVEDGRLAEADLSEIGELISGERPGRPSPDQITLYRSVGVAVQDAVAARLIYDAARDRGVGLEVDL